METLSTWRKPVSPVSFGVEIEGHSDQLPSRIYQHVGFFFITRDVSLPAFDESVEVVSQPLPYKMLMQQLDKMELKGWDLKSTTNAGIHVHITKNKKNIKRAEELNQYFFLFHTRFYPFFLRDPNRYCSPVTPFNFGHTNSRMELFNMTRKDTIECRGFGNSDMYISHRNSSWQIARRAVAIMHEFFSMKEVSLKSMDNLMRKYTFNLIEVYHHAS